MRERFARLCGRIAAVCANGLLRNVCLASLGLGALCGEVCPAAGQLAGGDLPSYDARVHDDEIRDEALAALSIVEGAKSSSGDAFGTDVRVSWDVSLGTPRFVRSTSGYLRTGEGEWLTTLSDYLDDQADLFGVGSAVLAECRVVRDFVSSGSGIRHVTWQQMMNGRDIAHAALRANFDGDGNVLNVSSTLLDPAELTVDQASNTAESAIAVAAAEVGIVVTESLAASVLDEDSVAIDGHPDFGGRVEARRVYFPVSRMRVVESWVVDVPEPGTGNVYSVTVGAAGSEVLYRWNRTAYAGTEAASYGVYPGDSPTPLSPGLAAPGPGQPADAARVLALVVADDPVASPLGWIADGENETAGNNVVAQTDLDGNNLPDFPRPAGIPYRVFNFPLDLTQSPLLFPEASVTQLFYLCNVLHDVYYGLGFDEASGNFQSDNFGRGGLANDALNADALDGSGVNNANFLTPADGSPPRMQMFRFDGPTPDRDASYDAEIVIHEYTHGVSNRLHDGLSALQSRGMGEGWSDFYGLSLLAEADDDLGGNYAFGAYASHQLAGLAENYYFGIRRYPYSTAQAVNPLTLADIDPAQLDLPADVPRSPIIVNTADSVHNIGEVWCSILWDCRARVIEAIGFEGNQVILRLVTTGMKLSPSNPTFVDARDAILQADLVLYGGAHQCALWEGFAARGLGVSADVPAASTTSGVAEAFDVPEDVCVTGRGVVTLDTDVYGCEGSPVVDLIDSHLAGAGVVVVEAWSDVGDVETILLTEVSPGSDEFTGSVVLSGESASVQGDGVLFVEDAGEIAIVYFDADDGTGSGVDVVTEAAIDCVAPVASDVRVEDISGVGAEIRFETDEPSVSVVHYGIDCGALTSVATGTSAVSHAVILAGLPALSTIYFVVEVRDAAGNVLVVDGEGDCFSFETPEFNDYLTEQFEAGAAAMSFQRLRYVPGGGAGYYDVCVEPVTELPVSTAGATRVFLSDDDYERIELDDDRRVWLFGAAYDSFYVSSNGYVTFGEGDFSRNESLTQHFAMPRVSALFDDLNPGRGGEVSVLTTDDRAVITFFEVPEFVNTGSNTFQIELFYSGEIAVSYLSMSATDGIVGVSSGAGMPADFLPSDFASFGACPPLPPVPCRDGDVNGDCAITPADALAAFEHYLHGGILAEATRMRADVSEPLLPPRVTPADALCIFEEYLERPSCFGPFPLDCSCQDVEP